MYQILVAAKTAQLDETLRRLAFEQTPLLHSPIQAQTTGSRPDLPIGFGAFSFEMRDGAEPFNDSLPQDVADELTRRERERISATEDNSTQSPNDSSRPTSELDRRPRPGAPPHGPHRQTRPEGDDLADSPPPHSDPRRRGPQPIPPTPELVSEFVFYSDLTHSDWHIAHVSIGRMHLFYGYNNDLVANDIKPVARSGLMLSPLIILLVAAGSWLLASRAVKPVQKLTQYAQLVTASDLSQRIPTDKEDPEFAKLISVFNAMLDRLQASFHQSQRFSANAAHELKTPLTILQGQLEQTFADASDDSVEQLQSHSMLEEIHRLKSITERLLLLSKSDSGTLTLIKSDFDYGEFLESLFEDAKLLAPDLTFEASLPSGIRLHADPALLYQLVTNLVSNAIKYNRPDGTIHIQLERIDHHATLRITNTGDAIPDEAAEKIFERFYRADTAHNRKIDGIGLGLNIALEITRAHDGGLVLERNESDAICFRFSVPIKHTASN